VALAASRSNAPGALQSLQVALRIARTQGATVYSLRSATDLARLHADEGRRDEAVAALGSVLEEVEAGCACEELDAARGLFTQLL
jgi:hypothetical protein